jgi:2-desacetyl-2-hydroxyethyl bacteriochlorophyllide A dehydrogenase
MRAGVYRGPSRIDVEELDDPVLGEGELRLDIAACGICGSDLHYYTEGWMPVGTVLGHEFAGVVSEIGPGVADVAVGDRVTINGIIGCGVCALCRAGRQNLCPDKRGPSRGAFAERFVVPADAPVYRLPDGMATDTAAFLEPLSTSLEAVRRAAPDLDEPIVVLGLGTIGLGVVAALEALGATTVIGVDLSGLRLATARALGAEVVVDGGSEDVVEAVSAVTGRSRQLRYEFARAGTVFDCSGVGRLVGVEVEQLVRAGGTLCVVSLFEEPVALDFNPLVRKEVDVVGSWAYTYAVVDEAFELLASGRVDPAPLVSHRFGLEDINAAFAAQMDKDHSVKVLIEP